MHYERLAAPNLRFELTGGTILWRHSSARAKIPIVHEYASHVCRYGCRNRCRWHVCMGLRFAFRSTFWPHDSPHRRRIHHGTHL
jgi:hypothetical protein